MIYKIDLNNDSNDEFEKNADNTVEIQIFNKAGEDITKDLTVNMYLSKNGLIGLGTELIRLAHHFKEGKHMHLEPSEENRQVQKMGVFLTPESGKLTILCNHNKHIDDYFSE